MFITGQLRKGVQATVGRVVNTIGRIASIAIPPRQVRVKIRIGHSPRLQGPAQQARCSISGCSEGPHDAIPCAKEHHTTSQIPHQDHQHPGGAAPAPANTNAQVPTSRRTAAGRPRNARARPPARVTVSRAHNSVTAAGEAGPSNVGAEGGVRRSAQRGSRAQALVRGTRVAWPDDDTKLEAVRLFRKDDPPACARQDPPPSLIAAVVLEQSGFDLVHQEQKQRERAAKAEQERRQKAVRALGRAWRQQQQQLGRQRQGSA